MACLRMYTRKLATAAAFSLSLSSAAAYAPLFATTQFSSQQQQHAFALKKKPQTISLFSTDFDGATDKSSSTSPLGEEWKDVLPLEKGSHNSCRIKVLSSVSTADDLEADPFAKEVFQDRLESTITACRELGKSSLWVEVPMERASLIESMGALGLRFHHASDQTAVLNIWLRDDSESKIPEYATHNVGVGAVVVNSRDEILLVRELRKNYMPWKTPTGLTELGEQIGDAAVREVMEETGISTEFQSILSFRQTHGLSHGRSDLFFVCRLDPVEDVDTHGQPVIPTPMPQECEIEKAEWVPLDEYRAMINDSEQGHPMMRHVIDVFDAGKRIEKKVVHSVVPGRKPNAIYLPSITDSQN